MLACQHIYRDDHVIVKTQKELTVIIDKAPPEIKITNLSDNDVTTKGNSESNGLSIKGTAEENNLSGLKYLRYKLNDGEFTDIKNLSQSWTINLNDLPEGKNRLEITASDNVGNIPETSTVINFTTDYNMPVVYFGDGEEERSDINVSDNVTLKGKITDGINTDGLSFELSYTRSDGESKTLTSADGFVWNNSGDNPPYTWSWTLPVLDAEGRKNDGRYMFTLNATDVAGRNVTKTRTVVMDTTGPEINTTISSGSSFSKFSNSINVSSSDVLSGVDYVEWTLNEETETHRVTGNTTSVAFKEQGEGQKLTFTAYDKSGNSSQVVYDNLTVDTAPPTLNTDVFNKASTYIKKGGSFSILDSGTTDGANAIVATDAIAIDRFEVVATKAGVVQTGSGQPTGYWYRYVAPSTQTKKELKVSDLAGIPSFEGIVANDGAWSVTVTVYDRSSQPSEKRFDFTVDASPPVVEAFTPATNSYVTGSSVDLHGTIQEPSVGTGIESVSLTLTGTKTVDGTAASTTETVAASVSGRTWSYPLDLSKWNEGSLSVSATATDRAGNESESAVTASYTKGKRKRVVNRLAQRQFHTERNRNGLARSFRRRIHSRGQERRRGNNRDPGDHKSLRHGIHMELYG